MRTYRRHISLVILVSMILSSTSAFAEGGEQMGFTTYYFSDSGDNSVVTTSFTLAKNILEQTLLLIDMELDNVSVPPVTAVTGATRPQRRTGEAFEKSRGQIIVGVQQGIGQDMTVAGNFYRSQEVDYSSNAVITTVTRELFQKNTALTLRGQYNADLVGEITPTGELVNQRKKLLTGFATIAHLLSPTTVLDLNYDIVYSWGFQSDPYRQVRVYALDGTSTMTDELHPGERMRHAGTLRLSQMISSIKASLIGSYRYYTDTWAVHSHTGELRLNKYIINNLILGIDYRYYSQSASYFTQDKYVGAEYLNDGLRTADYKLKTFSSNNFGFTLTLLLRGLASSSSDLEFLENSSIEMMYFRYFNDLDFSADIIQASIKFSI